MCLLSLFLRRHETCLTHPSLSVMKSTNAYVRVMLGIVLVWKHNESRNTEGPTKATFLPVTGNRRSVRRMGSREVGALIFGGTGPRRIRDQRSARPGSRHPPYQGTLRSDIECLVRKRMHSLFVGEGASSWFVEMAVTCAFTYSSHSLQDVTRQQPGRLRRVRHGTRQDESRMTAAEDIQKGHE